MKEESYDHDKEFKMMMELSDREYVRFLDQLLDIAGYDKLPVPEDEALLNK